MADLIECVPNFSEGRDKAKLDAIAEAMNMEGVYLLDRSMDADHNRAVITLAGRRGPLTEAVLRGIGKAAELIDLNQHQGVHPRIGATDVVPFVPLGEATLEECVQMARQVGAEVWRRYQVPVYLYEAAATRPGRVNLENIRRGQFEGVRAGVVSNPELMPDLGGPQLHPTAGAIAIGARKFLVAYNIYLDTADIGIARKVARAVRASSGGLPSVKAMGVQVRGRAQVSMNLTDIDQTPPALVFEHVKREAASHGAAPLSGEIVGLIPQKAVKNGGEWLRQVENFDSSMVLENRLAAAMGNDGW